MANEELKDILRSVIQEELKPVHEQLTEMKQDIAEIKQAVLETNERVVRIEASVDKQQGVIELLAARSIQQEAQLKKII